MPKLFYVKIDVSNGTLILDQSKIKQDYNELLVVPYRITKTQAKKLKEAITDRFLYADREPFLNEIEFEFYRIFRVCRKCGFVNNKEDVNKAWSGLCEGCFRKLQIEKRRKNQADKDERRKVRRYKEHLKTPQGRIDAIPISIIESNVRFEMIKQNISSTAMAEKLNISRPTFSKLFKNNTIEYKMLQDICTVLLVPIEKMLRLHRGMRIPKKHGIPAFWLEKGFKIKKY